jgi:hypothetical protein
LLVSLQFVVFDLTLIYTPGGRIEPATFSTAWRCESPTRCEQLPSVTLGSAWPRCACATGAPDSTRTLECLCRNACSESGGCGADYLQLRSYSAFKLVPTIAPFVGRVVRELEASMFLSSIGTRKYRLDAQSHVRVSGEDLGGVAVTAGL